MNELTLTIPADTKWTLALRSLAGAAGALAGLTLDTIDDLRIAVDEAFDLLTHQPLTPKTITMTCRPTERSLEVRMDCKRMLEHQRCEPSDPETARLIIGTLVADIHLEGDACGIHSVCMSMPLGTLQYER